MKNDSSRFGHIIQLFTVLLTAILISLFFAALVLVGKIQGTARVVNYAGLIGFWRSKTGNIEIHTSVWAEDYQEASES